MKIIHEFWMLILFQITFAAFGYFIQSLFQLAYDADLALRAMRMCIGYVLPVVWFYRRHGLSLQKLGVTLPRKNTLLNFLCGILLYATAGLIFIKYEIFFAGWRREFNPFITLPLIFIMVSITDFWTRGFILQFLAEKNSKNVGIITQNAIWFIIHWYEILLIQEYTGVATAIIMTLFLSIGGDLLTLRSKQISGLMIGHFVLNLLIIYYANNSIPSAISALLNFIPL